MWIPNAPATLVSYGLSLLGKLSLKLFGFCSLCNATRDIIPASIRVGIEMASRSW